MPALDADRLAELHALRARAYGPAADIDTDPAARRRLDELEARRSAAVAVPSGEETPIAEDAPGPTVPGPTAPSVEPPVAAAVVASAPAAPEEPPAPPAPPGPWRVSTRMKMLWAFSLVSAIAVAVSITYTLTYFAPVSTSSGAPQVATLEPTPVDIPSGWGGAGPSSKTWAWEGLVAFETGQGYGIPGGSECFAVVADEQIPEEFDASSGWGMSGSYWSGCGVAVFPATVVVPLDSNVPEGLRERYPEGSVIQFARDGDRLGVFLAEGAEP